MKTGNVRTEINATINSVYGTYEKVYRYNGQEIPALHDLLGKYGVLRNGQQVYLMQSKDGIAAISNGNRLFVAYGRRLTAQKINGQGNLSGKNPDFDIMQILDVDGNLFWQRLSPIHEEVVEITDTEAKRLLKDLFGTKVKINQHTKKGCGRSPETIVSLLKKNHESETKTDSLPVFTDFEYGNQEPAVEIA